MYLIIIVSRKFYLKEVIHFNSENTAIRKNVYFINTEKIYENT